MALDVRSHHEQEHQITLTLRIENKTGKKIKGLDCGIEVHDRKGARIGMAEFDFAAISRRTNRHLRPCDQVTFGPDAGTMRMAYLQPKTVAIDVKKVRFADGSESGYDD